MPKQKRPQFRLLINPFQGHGILYCGKRRIMEIDSKHDCWKCWDSWDAFWYWGKQYDIHFHWDDGLSFAIYRVTKDDAGNLMSDFDDSYKITVELTSKKLKTTEE
jgi:hypothetical protein